MVIKKTKIRFSQLTSHHILLVYQFISLEIQNTPKKDATLLGCKICLQQYNSSTKR